MYSLGVSEFRANLNACLHQVEQGEIISLHVRGREIARVVPPTYAQQAAREELARLRQNAVVGDILTPLEDAWEAENDE